MLEIGSFIKMQRTKHKMTLGELAEGIVSVSYLSKIENLKTEPSPHIVELLCKRLGIDMDRTMDSVIEQKCETWFTMLLNKEDIKQINKIYLELEEILNSHLSDAILLFELHKIRYYLYLQDTKLALEQIKRLNKISHSFETKELYFWFKFQGNYRSEIGDHSAALEKYERAKELSRTLDIQDEEIADLHYTLAVTCSHLRQILEAINYANLALDTFMKKYNFIRCAQCHVVLGISYRRIKMHEKAIENYNLAKHLAELSNNNELIQLTNQNLGYLYATFGKSEEAITFYLEVFKDPEVDIENRIAATAELIKVYYKIDEQEKAKEKIEDAFQLLKEHSRDGAYEYYNYVIHTYYYSINNETTKFVRLVKDKFIPILKKREDHANLATFTTMLANHYEKMHKYKEATKYYKLANHSYNELSNI